MTRTAGAIWLAVIVIVVALPISYERLAVVLGPPIVKLALGMTGELLYMGAGFTVVSVGALTVVATVNWLYARSPLLLIFVVFSTIAVIALF